jgi:peptide/nickel transport system ATP-binding protein
MVKRNVLLLCVMVLYVFSLASTLSMIMDVTGPFSQNFNPFFQEVQTIQLVDSFMKLMLKIRDDFNTTYLHVTHDLAAARYISDRIAVMYAGMFLEVGSTDDVVLEPLHPHTQLLRKAAPDPDRLVSEKLGNTGEVPNLITPPKGCPFEPRCNYSMEKCKNIIPPYFEINERKIRCFLYEN